MGDIVEVVASAVGALLAVVFIALMTGGGIYRTECVTDDGRHLTGWGAQGDIPYLWDPGDGCEAHSLTRYLTGKVGLQEDIAK